MTTEQQSTSSSKHWQLSGIRHHIFLKVFPGLRHNLLGPISIARMNHSIMRRHLEKDVLDKGKMLDRLNKIELQLEDAVLAIRDLHIWDETSDAEALPKDIVAVGLKLMSSFLTLRNIAVERLPEDASQAGGLVRQSPFLYAWLGLLCYLEDHVEQPIDLNIFFHEPRQLEILITQPLYDVNAPRAADSLLQPIGLADLEMLADEAGIKFDINDNNILMRW